MADQTPGSLNQSTSSDLFGYVGLYYLPIEHLLVDYLVVAGRVVGDLQLAPGAEWQELRATLGSIKFDEPAKDGRAGTTFPTKVTAARSTGDDATLATLNLMDRRRYLVMLREVSGRLRLVGSREAWLTFLAGTAGAGPAARAGIEAQFSGELPRRSAYYSGSFPVAGAAAVGGDASIPMAGAGTVQVRNRKGDLMVEIPAGKTLIISSGFRVAFAVK